MFYLGSHWVDDTRSSRSKDPKTNVISPRPINVNLSQQSNYDVGMKPHRNNQQRKRKHIQIS